MEKKKLPLPIQIFIGLVLGIIAGLCLMKTPHIATAYILPIGTIFLNLIKFIVVPIVFFSIICGVISMKDIKKVGSIGVKTVVYYMCTTAVAVIIGLILANIFKSFFPVLQVSGLEYQASEAPSLMDTIVSIFPSNIISPFSSATMLQVIVASLFFGFGILLAGEKGELFGQFAESASEVSLQIMSLIISLSPIGVFCLIAPVVAENGPVILGSLAMVLAVAYMGYILHAVLVYSSTVGVLGGVSP